MERFERELVLPVPPEELFAWHERPGAFTRLMPPWQRIEVVKEAGGIQDGQRLVFRVRTGGVWMEWEALHQDYQLGRQFVDVQVRGPFKSWRHLHAVEPHPAGSKLLDSIEYELPGGPLGSLLGKGKARNTLDRMFTFRHARTQADVLAHHAWSGQRLHVAITGATGMIGQALAAFLEGGGHQVSRLVRRKPGAIENQKPGEIAWAPQSGWVQPGGLEGVDAIIHLAGANVGEARWSQERKREILESREAGARTLVQALAAMKSPPSVFITASAVGYYGDRGEEWVDEQSDPGEGFLCEVCQTWEQAAFEAQRLGIRVAALRLGVVLSGQGGALSKMLPAFLAGAGGRLGSGKQYFSWVSLDDVLMAFSSALQRPTSGVVNVVAPNPVTQGEFAKTLGAVLGRPALVPTPASAVKMLFGEMGEAMLLAGARVRPQVLLDSGFEYRFADLEDALRFELGR